MATGPRAKHPAKKARKGPGKYGRPVVIKLGGELLEEPRRLRRIARALVRIPASARLVVVHGGGREVDTEMARAGIPKRAIDGLRITDAFTLDVILGVLAGRVNTRLVAAIGAAGRSAVGLTGADAGITRVRRARRYRATDGSRVDLGFVGLPAGNRPPRFIANLCRSGHIPVVASIGSDAAGRLYNVNADTMAGDLAERLGAQRLIMAGTTGGVLDEANRTISEVDNKALIQLIREGQVSVGMIAKLLACRAASQGGVDYVEIVDGRRNSAFDLSRYGGKDTTIITGGHARGDRD